MSWHVHQGLEFTKESKDKTGDGLKPAKESQDKTVDGAADDSAGEFERRAEAVYLQVLSAACASAMRSTAVLVLSWNIVLLSPRCQFALRMHANSRCRMYWAWVLFFADLSAACEVHTGSVSRFKVGGGGFAETKKGPGNQEQGACSETAAAAAGVHARRVGVLQIVHFVC